MTDRTKVIHGDCMELMKDYPDKYFELAIVDPPYGIDINKSGRLVKEKGWEYKKWDQGVPDSPYFNELRRLSVNQIIWGGNYFDLPPTKCFLIWDKQQPEDVSFASCELAWTSFTHVAKTFYQRPQGEDRIHPTQKPVKLYRWLLKNYAKEGDKILDTHGGSMSSVLACLDMGYTITCFELDEDYYNLAKLRIQNHLSQINAFRPPYEIEFHDNTGVSILRDQRTIRD